MNAYPEYGPPPRRRPSALAVWIVFGIALLGLFVYQGAARAVCPHPISAGGQVVSCTGAVPAANPSPSPAR